MDFGIARAMADSAATMTQTQAVIGTAQYLSPEQARGETVDARSDLYSTGCLLFELLTGRPPFTGDSPVAVAYQHVREAAPVPVDVRLRRARTRSTASRSRPWPRSVTPATRSAAEFRSDLEAAVRGGAVGAPAVGALAAAALVATPATEATQLMAPPVATTQTMPPATSPWAATGAAVATTDGIDDEDEGNKRPWLLPVLIAIAVLAVGGDRRAAASRTTRRRRSTTVPVPTVVGQTEAEAQDADHGGGPASTTRADEASDTVAVGARHPDRPARRARRSRRSRPSTAIISTGPASLAVPDVSGKTEQEADRHPDGRGPRPSPPTGRTTTTPTFPQGQVTKTDPPEGTSVSCRLHRHALRLHRQRAGARRRRQDQGRGDWTLLNAAKLQVNTSPVESPNTPRTPSSRRTCPATRRSSRAGSST